MNTAYLSLGTNLGDKLQNLNSAILKIAETSNILKTSSVYQTPSLGFESDDFYNIAIKIESKLNSDQLIDELLVIESELGRTRNLHLEGYQARPLDIDIIFYNDEIINSKKLIIPHPRMQDRKFVLIPLLDIISSNFKHPSLNKTLKELLNQTKDNSEITLTKHTLIKKRTQ